MVNVTAHLENVCPGVMVSLKGASVGFKGSISVYYFTASLCFDMTALSTVIPVTENLVVTMADVVCTGYMDS